MQYLKADAIATILIGPFLDKGDGVTPEEGVTLAAADSAEIMKHDGTTFVDIAGANGDQCTLTHKEKGMYTLAIPAATLDTEGRLTVFISDESVCLPVWKDFMVVNANVYDSLFAAAAADYLQVDTKQIEGGDATDAINAACDAAIETYKLDHLVSAADGDDPVDNSIIAKLVSKDATADWSDYVNTTESLEALKDGVLADIETDTAEIGTAGAGLSDLGGMSTTMKGQVEDECTDALEADGLDHLLAASVTGTDITDNSIIAKIVSKDATADWDDFVNTTDSLQAIRDKETDIETDTAVIGALGAGLTDLGGMSTTMKGQIQTECDDALVANNLDHLCKTVTAAADMTTEVVDNTILSRVLANGDTSAFVPSTDAIQLIHDDVATVDTVVDAIKAKTDNLPSGPAKNSALSGFTFVMRLALDHVSVATGKTITAQISKDKGAFANCTNSVTEIANGVYYIDLTATEMNADVVTLKFTETDCDATLITILTST